MEENQKKTLLLTKQKEEKLKTQITQIINT